MPDGIPRSRQVDRLLRSPTMLLLVVSTSPIGFEVMHRVLGFHPVLSSALLMVVFFLLTRWADRIHGRPGVC